MRLLAPLMLLAACVGPIDDRRDDARSPGWDRSGSTTGPTVGSGTDTQTLDCGYVPPVPVDVQVFTIQTEEDFAFDALGRVLYQSGHALVAATQKGVVSVVSTGGSADPSGLEMVTPTEVVIASPDTGSLDLALLETGANWTLIGGLSEPNGVETSRDGTVFWTERLGGVGWIDPLTGVWGEITDEIPRPNGVALSQDEETLYVAGEDGLYAIARTERGWTDATAELAWAFDEPTIAGTVDVDVCGNLYTIGYDDGRLWRVDAATGEGVLLADFSVGGSFGFSALQFGNGIGGWSRSALFATNRREIYGIPVGLPGAAGVTTP